eukprot:m51a1_g3644 hypothetical protein (640) ;mRNA; f:185240-189497
MGTGKRSLGSRGVAGQWEVTAPGNAPFRGTEGSGCALAATASREGSSTRPTGAGEWSERMLDSSSAPLVSGASTAWPRGASFPRSFDGADNSDHCDSDVCETGEEQRRAAWQRLAEVSQWFPLSPTMAWLVGAWHHIVDHDHESAIAYLETSRSGGSALGTLELGFKTPPVPPEDTAAARLCPRDLRGFRAKLPCCCPTSPGWSSPLLPASAPPSPCPPSRVAGEWAERMLDASSAPLVAPTRARESTERASQPLSIAGAEVDEADVLPREWFALVARELDLFVGCPDFRRRVNEALAPYGADDHDSTSAARDVFEHCLKPAVRGLEPFRGCLYTAVAAPDGRDLVRGDVLTWHTLAFASPDDGAVTGLCRTFARVPGARVVLLQCHVTEGAWLLSAGPQGSSEGPREVVLEPGWAYDVVCTGTTRTGPAAWATLSQRCVAPEVFVGADVPLSTSSAASLDVALPVLCRMVDDNDVSAAAAALPVIRRAAASDPLVLAVDLAGGPCDATEEQRERASLRLAEVSQWFMLSPTMAWLVGAWHRVVDRDSERAIACLETSRTGGSALGTLELGLCLAEAEEGLRDEGRAAALFEEAAEAGSAEALVALGRALLCSDVMRDVGEAKRRFSLAAAMGSASVSL